MNDITLKMIPVGEYEYVNVTFPLAGNDVTIAYKKLHVDSPDDVRWLDVSPNGGKVFRNPTTAFGPGYVKLRSDVSNYSTRLLLFTERNQSEI